MSRFSDWCATRSTRPISTGSRPMFEKLPAALAANPAIAARFDFADLAIGLGAGSRRSRLHIKKGVARIEASGDPVTFSLEASEEAWTRFASARPPVGYQ